MARSLAKYLRIKLYNSVLCSRSCIPAATENISHFFLKLTTRENPFCNATQSENKVGLFYSTSISKDIASPTTYPCTRVPYWGKSRWREKREKVGTFIIFQPTPDLFIVLLYLPAKNVSKSAIYFFCPVPPSQQKESYLLFYFEEKTTTKMYKKEKKNILRTKKCKKAQQKKKRSRVFS